MITEKLLFYCEWKIYSASVTNFIKLFSRSIACIRKWYWGMRFCRTRFPRNRIITEWRSVVEKKASKLWSRSAWDLILEYSDLSILTLCPTFDVMFFCSIIQYNLFSENEAFIFFAKHNAFISRKKIMSYDTLSSVFLPNTRNAAQDYLKLLYIHLAVHWADEQSYLERTVDF